MVTALKHDTCTDEERFKKTCIKETGENRGILQRKKRKAINEALQI